MTTHQSRRHRKTPASYPDVSLSLDENERAKEGGKETTGETSFRRPSLPFPWSLAVHHQSLVFRARLYDAKNEAPEEKTGSTHYFMINSQLF